MECRHVMLAECARAADRRELLVRAREKERGPSECSGSNRSIRAVSGVGRNTHTHVHVRTHTHVGTNRYERGTCRRSLTGARRSRSPSPSGPTSVRKGRPLFAIRRVRNRCAIRLSRLEANIIKYIFSCPRNESRTIGYVKLKQGVLYHRHSSRLFIFI